MKDKSSVYKIWIIIISIVLVICIPFISGSRDGREDFIKAIYGFPADWLYLYTNGGFSFLGIGFIVNIIFFYYMIKILIWAYKKIIGWIKGIWANLYY
ncbi:hypothetical protein ACIQVU_18310 [Lysinibacillus sp. NPDC098008]|uniref:hypothetical protein n=1 Tax=Lysinibacillus sp. NPDC098008 TaxID=3364146 RepID=UPI00380FADE2